MNEPRSEGAVSLVVVAGLAATLVLGLASDGVHHDDDLTHFLMARWTRWFPGYLLHFWGRPGLTLPMAAVAWMGTPEFGWHAARALSALATAWAALLAARLGTQLGVRRPWLIALACYLQPLNTVLAYTTLTENFAALYLIGALLLFDKGRVLAASIVFSLVLVTRYEALVLVPFWWLILAKGRSPQHEFTGVPMTTRIRALAAAATLWAPTAHNVLFRLVYGEWLVGAFARPTGSTEYPATPMFSYLPHALSAVPPAIFGLATFGTLFAVKGRGRAVALLAAVYFMTHCAFRAFGLYASGGYGRFMVTIAPLVAVLAVVGLESAWSRRAIGKSPIALWGVLAGVWVVGWLTFETERVAGRIPLRDPQYVRAIHVSAAIIGALLVVICWCVRRRPAPRWERAGAIVLGLTCVAAMATWVRPLRLDDNQRTARQAADWLVTRGLDQEPIFATNPWISCFLGLVEIPTVHKGPSLLANMSVRTIVIWDSRYSPSDYHLLPLARLRDDRHYAPLTRIEPAGRGTASFEIFRKVAPTPLPDSLDTPYPPPLPRDPDARPTTYYVRPINP